MSYFTQFSSASPAKVTTYTSGSGNFTPISTNQSWARITLVAGGGGGRGAGGGGGGTRIVEWVKLTLSSYPYAVGAGGAGGSNVANANAGGNTIFGSFVVSGGGAGSVNSLNVDVAGGQGGGTAGFVAADAGQGATALDIRLGGGRGGEGYNNDTGGSATRGLVVGTSLRTVGNNYNYGTVSVNNFTNNVTANGFGGGGGGDSYMGLGGAGGANINNNNGSAGNGYGAGGGGGLGNTGGAGTGGIIIVEEFVQ